MTILARMLERRSVDNPTLRELLENVWVQGNWPGGQSFAGPLVTPENSLRVSAVYACVTLIAESIAMLPGDLNRKISGTRVSAEEHPYQRLLFEEPNPEQDAGEFWRQSMGWMLLRGNAFAAMMAERSGLVTELWPIPASHVEVKRTEQGRLVYVVQLSKGELHRVGDRTEGKFALTSNEVLHFRAFGFGPVGLSPIGLARQGIGLAMGTEEYGARLFSNSAVPEGLIKVPKTLSDKAYERLRANWQELHQGLKRSHMVGLLEEGAEWSDTGLSNEDAQFLETRRFQVNDIARFFRVPPHMIGDVERSTSWGSGIEQQGIGFVIHVLLHWITRLERTVKRGLLRKADPALYAKWNLSALLRGDMRSRAAALAVMRQWGVINADEWRAFEDMDPIGGDAGQSYLNPLNFAPLAAAGVSEDDVRDLLEQLLPEALNGQRMR